MTSQGGRITIPASSGHTPNPPAHTVLNAIPSTSARPVVTSEGTHGPPRAHQGLALMEMEDGHPCSGPDRPSAIPAHSSGAS